MIITYIISAVFLVLSIVFLCGKGAFLISGYNTASEEEKKQYNVKRLTRVMGIGMAAMAIMILFMNSSYDWVFPLLPVLFIVDIIVMIVFVNTYAKVKENEQAEKAKKSNTKTTIIVLVVTVIASTLFILLIGYNGSVGVDIDEDTIVLSATGWGDYTVDIDDINSVTYTDDLSRGKRTGGVGTFVHYGGNFNNDEFGDYILYAYANNDSSVMIHTDDNIVVFNAETKEETVLLYDKIQQIINN